MRFADPAVENVTRRAGWAALAAGVVQVAAGIAVTVNPGLGDRESWFFRYGVVLFVVVGLLSLAAVVGLWRSGMAGDGRLALAGVVLAGAGRVVFAVGEIVDRVSSSLGEVVLGIADPLTGLGLILLGVGVLRGHRWSGLNRWAALILGGYVFVVLVPAFAVAHGPNFLVVAGWGVLWCWFGAGLVASHRAGHPQRS